MEAIETFPNPPITEALLNIAVGLPVGANLSTLLPYHDLIRERFPQKQDRILQKIQFQLGPSPEAKLPSLETDGYMFLSPEKNKIVQANLSGFTFNRLKPYDRWSLFSAEARELWGKYCTVGKPVNVQRIGLRYINTIHLPLPVSDLDTYFTTAPRTPPGLYEGVSGFFMQISATHRTSAARGVVTQTFQPIAQEDQTLCYILDIDVSFQYTVHVPVSDSLWENINLLHDFKNEIFFSSITEKTKELFR